jgi:hypothetical protein
MVMVALLGAAHAGEEGLGAVRAGAVHAVGDRVIDDFDAVAGVQIVPGAAFVHHDFGLAGNPVTDEGQGRTL